MVPPSLHPCWLLWECPCHREGLLSSLLALPVGSKLSLPGLWPPALACGVGWDHTMEGPGPVPQCIVVWGEGGGREICEIT